MARRTEDVWPGTVRVFPDGTCYSAGPRPAALTDPDGEVLVRAARPLTMAQEL